MNEDEIDDDSFLWIDLTENRDIKSYIIILGILLWLGLFPLALFYMFAALTLVFKEDDEPETYVWETILGTSYVMPEIADKIKDFQAFFRINLELEDFESYLDLEWVYEASNMSPIYDSKPSKKIVKIFKKFDKQYLNLFLENQLSSNNKNLRLDFNNKEDKHPVLNLLLHINKVQEEQLIEADKIRFKKIKRKKKQHYVTIDAAYANKVLTAEHLTYDEKIERIMNRLYINELITEICISRGLLRANLYEFEKYINNELPKMRYLTSNSRSHYYYCLYKYRPNVFSDQSMVNPVNFLNSLDFGFAYDFTGETGNFAQYLCSNKYNNIILKKSKRKRTYLNRHSQLDRFKFLMDLLGEAGPREFFKDQYVWAGDKSYIPFLNEFTQELRLKGCFPKFNNIKQLSKNLKTIPVPVNYLSNDYLYLIKDINFTRKHYKDVLYTQKSRWLAKELDSQLRYAMSNYKNEINYTKKEINMLKNLYD